MKLNVFIEQHDLLKSLDNQIVTVGGHRAIDIYDPEEQIINDLDKKKFTPEQWRARKFVEFLGNRRLDMAKFTKLDSGEQTRLAKEFLETFEA